MITHPKIATIVMGMVVTLVALVSDTDIKGAFSDAMDHILALHLQPPRP